MTRPETVPCPICAGPVRLYDVVDFNKSCVDLTARRSGLSGTPIYYHQCTHCHFIFAPECYAWTKKEFAEKIYNADYVLFDPEFVSERPLSMQI